MNEPSDTFGTMGLLNISLQWPIDGLNEIDISSRREWSKKYALAKAVGPSSKAAAILTHGAYSQYVSANAAGGFYQHSNNLSLSKLGKWHNSRTYTIF